MSQSLIMNVISWTLFFQLFFISINSESVIEKNLPPNLYLGKNVTKCTTDSPEYYYRDVVIPTLSALQKETQGFLGILMDKLEDAISESNVIEPKNQDLEKQWLYIFESVKKSMNGIINQIKHTWGIISLITSTDPLPWELSVKNSIIEEFFNNMGRQYLMVEQILKAGLKEVLGTLQYQLANVIQKMESHVSQMTKDGEEITEKKLLKKMQKSLEKMEPNFIGNLLKKIVKRAIAERTTAGAGSTSTKETKLTTKPFHSKILEQTAIVFEAYKKRGHLYPKFWKEITEIMKEDLNSNPSDISSFVDFYRKNEEEFMENVISILTSSKK